jgi:hypothetical protein
MPPANSISNRLLLALTLEDLDGLRAHLELVPLPHKRTLSKPGAPIQHLYFPQEGMVSLVQPLTTGTPRSKPPKHAHNRHVVAV